MNLFAKPTLIDQPNSLDVVFLLYTSLVNLGNQCQTVAIKLGISVTVTVQYCDQRTHENAHRTNKNVLILSLGQILVKRKDFVG